jgi:RNA polymerase sigma-54 factor
MLGIPTAQAREIARFISDNLNPFPGRAHWGDLASGRGSRVESEYRPYTTPDVIISLLMQSEDSPLVVEIALPMAGILRVNPLFREAVQHAPESKTEQWQADLEQANLLVKCIQQRNHTIVRLMQRLSVLQREFILHGEACLQPLTRAILAKELDVHESTISRAVSAKSVQLPNGHIVPLSMFFDRSLHIRTALKKIVSQEKQPLSDTQIGEILARQGYPIARRTVAKYRAMEGILPAHLRKPAYAALLDKNLASRAPYS